MGSSVSEYHSLAASQGLGRLTVHAGEDFLGADAIVSGSLPRVAPTIGVAIPRHCRKWPSWPEVCRSVPGSGTTLAQRN